MTETPCYGRDLALVKAIRNGPGQSASLGHISKRKRKILFPKFRLKRNIINSTYLKYTILLFIFNMLIYLLICSAKIHIFVLKNIYHDMSS